MSNDSNLYDSLKIIEFEFAQDRKLSVYRGDILIENPVFYEENGYERQEYCFSSS